MKLTLLIAMAAFCMIASNVEAGDKCDKYCENSKTKWNELMKNKDFKELKEIAAKHNEDAKKMTDEEFKTKIKLLDTAMKIFNNNCKTLMTNEEACEKLQKVLNGSGAIKMSLIGSIGLVVMASLF